MFLVNCIGVKAFEWYQLRFIVSFHIPKYKTLQDKTYISSEVNREIASNSECGSNIYQEMPPHMILLNV